MSEQTHILLRVSPELVAQFDEVARAHERSRAAQLRWVMRESVERSAERVDTPADRRELNSGEARVA